MKEYVREYAKYLGLNSDEILDEFNDFLFEKTSKISLDDIKEARNAIKNNEKEDTPKVYSPYTKIPTRRQNYAPYILGGLAIIVVLILFYMLLQNIRPNETRTSELLGGYEVDVI